MKINDIKADINMSKEIENQKEITNTKKETKETKGSWNNKTIKFKQRIR